MTRGRQRDEDHHPGQDDNDKEGEVGDGNSEHPVRPQGKTLQTGGEEGGGGSGDMLSLLGFSYARDNLVLVLPTMYTRCGY